MLRRRDKCVTLLKDGWRLDETCGKGARLKSRRGQPQSDVLTQRNRPESNNKLAINGQLLTFSFSLSRSTICLSREPIITIINLLSINLRKVSDLISLA